MRKQRENTCSTTITLTAEVQSWQQTLLHSFELQLSWQDMTHNWCNSLFREKKMSSSQSSDQPAAYLVLTWRGSQK